LQSSVPGQHQRYRGRVVHGHDTGDDASAFAVGDAGYLLRTWHPSGRPEQLTLDPALQWNRLAVLATEGGGIFDTRA
jgi:hypothetical protein